MRGYWLPNSDIRVKISLPQMTYTAATTIWCRPMPGILWLVPGAVRKQNGAEDSAAASAAEAGAAIGGREDRSHFRLRPRMPPVEWHPVRRQPTWSVCSDRLAAPWPGGLLHSICQLTSLTRWSGWTASNPGPSGSRRKRTRTGSRSSPSGTTSVRERTAWRWVWHWSSRQWSSRWTKLTSRCTGCYHWKRCRDSNRGQDWISGSERTMTVFVSGLFSILCVSEADCCPSEDTDHIHKTSKIIPETLKIDH